MQTQPVGGAGPQTYVAPDPIGVAGYAAPAKAASVAPTPTPQHVQAAIGEANKTMKAIDAAIQFVVDPETKMTVIKIVDTANNTVLRQVPTQEMLEIAQALDRMQGLLFSQKA